MYFMSLFRPAKASPLDEIVAEQARLRNDVELLRHEVDSLRLMLLRPMRGHGENPSFYDGS